MEHQRALTQALDACKEDILAFAKDLISIASENPPGNYYRECADRIRAELADAAMRARVAGPDDVYGRAHEPEKSPHTRRKVTA